MDERLIATCRFETRETLRDGDQLAHNPEDQDAYSSNDTMYPVSCTPGIRPLSIESGPRGSGTLLPHGRRAGEGERSAPGGVLELAVSLDGDAPVGATITSTAQAVRRHRVRRDPFGRRPGDHALIRAPFHWARGPLRYGPGRRGALSIMRTRGFSIVARVVSTSATCPRPLRNFLVRPTRESRGTSGDR